MRLASALSRLHRTTGVSLAFAGEVTDWGLKLSSFEGPVVGPLRGAVLSVGHGLGGRVMQELRPAALYDYVRSPKITHTYDEIIRAEQLRTLVAVPVVIFRRPVAVLYVATRAHSVELGRLFDATVNEARVLEQELITDRLIRNSTEDGAREENLRSRVRDVYLNLHELARDIGDPELRDQLLGITKKLSNRTDSVTSYPPLTTREQDVLVLLATGLKNQAIADHLGIGLHTVKGYVKRLMDKLEAGSRMEVVAHARRGNLIP